jgi:LCP family protein required for cell wall assembly
VWIAGAVACLLVAVAAVGYAAYQHYDDQIHRVNVLATKDPNIKEATRQLHAQNFLLIGSDTRAGADKSFETSPGEVSGARSDTTILAHISPTGAKATMVSFPRDAWVHVPSCQKSGGQQTKPYQGSFNSAFELGGPACTIRLVQSMTGIKITHFVQVDFSGFTNMVRALGGVPVCSPTTVDDPKSGLRLHPGTQMITGTQALAYVRARYTLGDGSDLDRIKRQQSFLGSVIRVATSKGILFNPGRLKSFLDAATRSVTLDKGTHITDLYNLAGRLRHLDPAHATFFTAPIANRDYAPPGYPANAGKVLLDQAAGTRLWKDIIDDSTVTTKSPAAHRSGTPKKSPSPKPSSKPSSKPTPKPSQPGAINASDKKCTV